MSDTPGSSWVNSTRRPVVTTWQPRGSTTSSPDPWENWYGAVSTPGAGGLRKSWKGSCEQKRVSTAGTRSTSERLEESTGSPGGPVSEDHLEGWRWIRSTNVVAELPAGGVTPHA